MADSELFSQSRKTLSASERYRLIQYLNGLPGTQLEELIFALAPPSGVISPATVAQGNRTSELLRWMEGSTGPGLIDLFTLLGSPAQDFVLKSSNTLDSQAINLFTVPYDRNNYFTGRESILSTLHSALQRRKLAALSGLGGIGKTQIAVEYAYRYRDAYKVVLWLRAETSEEFISAVVTLAQDLGLSQSQEDDQDVIIRAVKRWLTSQRNWLLVLDNADDFKLIEDWFLLKRSGHLLLTTRASVTPPQAERIEILKLPPEDGALLLLQRARILADQKNLNELEASEWALALALSQEMDGLPLALEQVGAYVDRTKTSLQDYQKLYQLSAPDLLAKQGDSPDHPSVTVTFSLAFERLAKYNSAAADILKLCAFFAPDAIPEEIFSKGSSVLGNNLQSVANNPLQFIEVLTEAKRFSLISRNGRDNSLSIHRLVQEVLRNELDETAHQEWGARAIAAINATFPTVDFATWAMCDRLLPHALAVIQLIESEPYESEASARLLNQTGYYLKERGRYDTAEPLLSQAVILRKKLLGKSHLDVAQSLNNLALVYHYQGHYDEAEPLYIEALKIRQQVLGESHPNVSESLSNLASLYHEQKHYAKAEPLFLQSLEMDKQLLGGVHPDLASNLNNLARFYGDQDRYDEAEDFFLESLEMRRQLLGEEHPYVAQSLNNLAKLYHDQERYSEAEPLYLEALEIWKKKLGEDHPDIGRGLDNLAMLYAAQGHFERARPLYEEALAILEQRLGSEHHWTVRCLENLETLRNQTTST